VDNKGVYYNMRTGALDPTLTPQSFLDYSIKGGFLHRGVTIGSEGTQASEFEQEMVNFFKEHLL